MAVSISWTTQVDGIQVHQSAKSARFEKHHGFFLVVEWILKDAAKTEASPFRVTNSMVQLAGAARGSSIRRTFRHPRHQTGPLQGENLGLIDSDRIKLNTEYETAQKYTKLLWFFGSNLGPQSSAGLKKKQMNTWGTLRFWPMCNMSSTTTM